MFHHFNHKLFFTLSCTLFLSTACNKVSFQEVQQACEAPDSSARFGTNPGPVILAPLANSIVPGVVNVQGSCVSGLPVTITEASGQSSQVACVAGTFSAPVTLSDNDGVKDLSVSQDSNNGKTVTDRLCFSKDATPPVVLINGNGAQAISAIPATSVSGTCESGLSVVLTGPGLANPVTTSCDGGNFSASLQLTSPDGIKDIRATQIDVAGNQGQDATSVTLDATPPVVRITSPAALTATRNGLTVSGTCEAGLRVGIGDVGTGNVVMGDCLAGTFSIAVTLPGVDGLKVVKAFEVDIAGNIGQDSRNYMKDTTAPTVTIALPLANAYLSPTSTFSGACENGSSVQLSGTVLASGQTVPCNGSLWTLTSAITPGQGAKTLTASQTDAVGNVGQAQSQFQVDTVAPVLAFTNPAVNSYIASTFMIQGTCEAGLTVQVSGAGVLAPASAPCNAGTFSATLMASVLDGVKTVVISQVDAAGNSGTASRNFLRDTLGPILSIASPVNGSYVLNTVTLSGVCEAALTVSFSGAGLAGTGSTVCTAGGTYSLVLNISAGDGNKVILASETDGAGNNTQVTATYIKDTTPPVVVITSPLANTQAQNGLTVGGTCEAGLNVTLAGSGVSAPVNTTCTAGTFSAAIIFTAVDGAKTVTASQTDAAGNSGTGSQIFIRNNAAPAIAITQPAANSYLPATFTLQGTCVTGLNVVVGGTGITSGSTVSCVAGAFSAPGLIVSAGDGSKNVTATQTDAIGNVGTAARNFLRDTVAPALSITYPLNNSYVNAAATLTGACETGLTISFSGAGLASAGSTVCTGAGTYSVVLTISAGDGSKVILASETDAAGNTATATAIYIKDTTAPLVDITTPVSNTQAQNGLTVGGTCEAGLNVTLAGSGVSAPVTTTCAAGTFSAPVVFTAGDGNKAVTASQTDLAGNTGSDTETYIKNNVGPAITITQPAANSYLPATFTLQGTCVTGLNVVVGGTGVAAPATVPCAAGAFSAPGLIVSSGDGIKNVTASQTDAIGNVGTAARNFLRDTVAPALSIISPLNNSFVNTTVTLTGACEAGLTVSFSGAGLAGAGSAVCTGAGTYSALLNISAGDGNKVITASETDGAGNNSQVTATYQRDSTAPLVAITSPAAGTQAQTGLTVSGTCEAGLNVVLSGSGVTSPVTTTCASGTFSGAIVFTAGDGNKTVSAAQTDAAGNTGSASQVYVKDTTPPAITISSPAANSYIGATFTLQGNCETGYTVSLGGSGLSSGSTTPCVAGAYSIAGLNVSTGDGTKTVTASQTDFSGNIGTASRNFLRDTVAPVLSIISPVNGSYIGNTATLAGVCEAGLTVSFSGAGLASGGSAVCSGAGTYSALLNISAGDGNKVITASETDGAGNNTQVSATYVKDGTAPLVAITSPAAGTQAQTGLTVDGTCEAGLNVTLAGSGVSSPVTTACSSGLFSAAIVFTAGDGTKAVTASQTDAAGNTGSNSRSFVKDTTAPILAITSPAANSFLPASFTLLGSCETGLNVVVGGSGLSAGATVPCNLGSFSAAGLTASAGDGAKTVTASQTDFSGNVGTTSRSFLRDTTAPVIAINSPAAGSNVAPTENIVGTCEAGLTVTLSGDLTSSATGACASGTFNVAVTFSAGLGNKNITASQTDAAGNLGQASSQFVRASNPGSDSFVSDASFGKIDILFVDDNSASMDPEQTSLATRFAGFSSELQNIDWQIGITTTDCSAGPYGICGSLLPLTGVSQSILTPSTPNYQTVFANSIQRPETAGCLATGTCPSGNSQPLLAATTAMNKFNTNNTGFFRANSDLAIVILTDADEGQTGGAAYSGRPTQLVSTFNSLWPADKKLSVYSISVKPGDSACLAQLTAANGGFSFYGTLVNQAVGLTSGVSESICAPDYSITLRSIGESVRTLTNSVQLSHTPIAASVVVTLTPNQAIPYKVIGDKVVFDSPPSVGTQIQVTYQY